MKKFTIKAALLLLTFSFTLLTAFGQSPEKMTYQSVIRNSSDQLATNTSIGMQISILQGSASGTAVYTERHYPTTNINGLVSLEIGTGTIISGDFSVIDWANDTYFLKTETDLNGGANYTITGTSQLLSVPYALHAKTAGTADYNNLTNLPVLNIANWDNAYSWDDHSTAGYLTSFTETDPIYTANFDLSSVANGDLLQYNGTQFVKFTPNYLTSETDDQNISGSGLSGTDLTIGIEDGTNEVVDLSSLQDGTGTDDQTLTEVLTESNDGGANQIKNIADPTDDQDAVTKAYVDLLEQKLITGGLLVKDYDGNLYNTVKIGTQLWMAEDLRVTHYPNGDPIPNITDNTAWGNLADNNTDDAYCFYDADGNGIHDNTDYGYLYTYAAAIGDNWARDNAANQGVCPDGWHLPTDAEWTTLTDYLDGTSVAGGKMKETGTTHWNSPNTGATNESGFTAFPGGYRSLSNGTFVSLGSNGYFWSATGGDATSAWNRGLGYSSSSVSRSGSSKSYGFSVRCLRD